MAKFEDTVARSTIISYRETLELFETNIKNILPSRNLYFDKMIFHSAQADSAVNEKEIQRDIHFEQSQRRIGEESEDTDANRLYFVVPKKGEAVLRAHLPRGSP